MDSSSQPTPEHTGQPRRRRPHGSWRAFAFALLALAGLLAFFKWQERLLQPAVETPAVGLSAPLDEVLEAMAGKAEPTLSGLYLMSRHAQYHKDDVAAKERMLAALALKPDDVQLAYEAMHAALMAGDAGVATELARRLDALPPKERDALPDGLPVARLLMVADDMKAKRYTDVQRRLELAIVDQNLGAFQRIFFTLIRAWAYAAVGDSAKAFEHRKILEKFEELRPFVLFHYAMIHAYLGQDAEAARTYAAALEGSATLPRRAAEIYANFLTHLKQPKEAKAAVDKFWQGNRDIWLEAEEIDAMLTAYGDKLMVATPEEGVAELLYGASSLAYQQSDIGMAYKLLYLALTMREDFPIARVLLATYMEHEDRYRDAIAMYGTIEEDSPFWPRARMEQAQLLAASGDEKEALKQLRKLEKDYEKSPNPWLHQADILRKQKSFAEAAEKYGEAIKRFTGAHPYQWPVYYMRAICYERSKQWDKAEADFNKALELSPDNPDVLNYLAYSWVEMGKNYDKALEMLMVAVTARPYDAHIIDSVGWVYYKLGDLDKAIKYIERAIELMPDDATVNDHLGDLYWHAGRKREARFQWERALLFEPEPELEQALKRKLKEGLPEAAVVGLPEAAVVKDGAGAGVKDGVTEDAAEEEGAEGGQEDKGDGS